MNYKTVLPVPFKFAVIVLMLITPLIFQSCRKSRSDIGKVVFKETRNKIFKRVEADAFNDVFREVLKDEKTSLQNPNFITAFYENNDYDPIILMNHLAGGDLKAAADRFSQAAKHGLDPKLFDAAEYNALITKLYDKKAIKTVEEAYKVLAKIEIMSANSLINYSNALQFGVISPRRIFARYYTETKRPDSAAMLHVMQVKDLKMFLDSVQPTGKQYLAIQKALAENVQVPGTNKEESQRIMIVNLERLRWKNQPTEKKYVWVNIPDFRLDVIENGKSALNMKVCVGEGRNISYTDKLVEYDENDLKKDRPFTRETPQLKSMIHSVQVNPVWNIPESIATNEISKLAAKDPYYLANNNIDVFLDGNIVENPEEIDWSAGNAGKVYSFKQRPGDDNSLGKIKFLFNNASSVYLHDTPAKAAFSKHMRAVSHGCVRVEKPLDLAHALFGDGNKFDQIRSGMQSQNPVATDISLPTQVPVYLTYFTCWLDETGVLQFRKDVYGLDIVLYTYMQRLTA